VKKEIKNKNENSLFLSVFNNNQAIMLLVDPNNNQQILDANEAAQKFYGYTREQFLLLNMGHVNTTSEKERHRMMVEAINKPHSYFNFVHKTSSGSLKNVEVNASPLLYNSKTVMFVIVHDITELKSVESKLKESEEKFKSYFDSSPLSLWEEDYSEVFKYLHSLPVADETELYTYLGAHPDEIKKCLSLVKILNVNQATLTLYEAESKEIMIDKFSNIFTPSTLEAFKDELISYYKNDLSMVYYFTDKTLKGRAIDVKLEMTLLSNYRYLTTITDITELKKKESNLQELLNQTKADSETKEILLREINHRVKNNLSSFIGMLYAEKKQSGTTPDDVQMQHVDSLINRVKGISVAHEMLSRTYWAPVPIFKLAEKIIHSLNHLIPKDRQIDTIISPSNILLDADQSHSLAIIINELFSNSIEHASIPGGKIKVEIDIIEKNGKILFIYRDSGPGFPESILKSEFHNVGMYLMKNIVLQSLRGTLEIANKGGVIIEIEFPGGSKLEEL
jgi:PAS domain S-box-containing protein